MPVTFNRCCRRSCSPTTTRHGSCFHITRDTRSESDVGVPERVTERATRLLAPNPSPMTLEGTNTWVLREPGVDGGVVVDPGPLHEEHLAGIAALGPVTMIVLT